MAAKSITVRATIGNYLHDDLGQLKRSTKVMAGHAVARMKAHAGTEGTALLSL